MPKPLCQAVIIYCINVSLTYTLTTGGADSTTLLLRGIPVNPGGGLGADIPRPGGGRGTVEDGGGVEAFIGKEVLKPKK